MIESEALAASAAPFGWAAHGTEGAADKQTMVSMTGRAGRVGPRGAPVRRPREKSRGRSDENERIADIIKGWVPLHTLFWLLKHLALGLEVSLKATISQVSSAPQRPLRT
jgi:hypothetical protein